MFYKQSKYFFEFSRIYWEKGAMCRKSIDLTEIPVKTKNHFVEVSTKLSVNLTNVFSLLICT